MSSHARPSLVHTLTLLTWLCLLTGGTPARASEPAPARPSLLATALEDAHEAFWLDGDDRGTQQPQPFDAPIFDGTVGTFDLASALRQSMLMLTVQHSARMFQEKTRRELSGPFWRDYVQSVKGLGGWDDGDSALINFVGHPMQGAVSGYVQIQNDGTGRAYEFGRSREYWKSRMQALAWAAAYSTQFELGPYSEASIGNVGLHPGTMGWVDLVVTPLGGLGLIVAEDAFDVRVLQKLEGGGSAVRARVLRTLLTPNRALANLLRMEVPWHRDTRPVPGGRAERRRERLERSDPLDTPRPRVDIASLEGVDEWLLLPVR